MRKKNSAPTMKDVALEAGVALGTVSKVINGLPVGESYRIRVEAAIEKLHYQVNSYAQGLKASRTYTVAVLMPNVRNPYFANLTNLINKELTSRKYRMLLCCTESDPAFEQEYVTIAQQNKVDGIIGLTYNSNLQVNPDTPFISIDRVMGAGIPCVTSDNFMGGQLAAEKLAELGCQNVAFLRIGSSLSNEPNKRKAGFENSCQELGLHYTSRILDDTEPMAEFDAFLSEHLHEGKLDFDGLFCATDLIAYYIIKRLKKLNIKIPEDVQVIGFDGVQPFGGELDYICSTIVQPVEDMAKTCVQVLLQDSLGSGHPLICLPVSYMSGGTTREEPKGQGLFA